MDTKLTTHEHTAHTNKRFFKIVLVCVDLVKQSKWTIQRLLWMVVTEMKLTIHNLW